MKQKEKNEKLMLINRLLEDRFSVECEDDGDWMHHYESILTNIELLVNEMLGKPRV
jgi:hypothetical protein